MKAQQPYDPIHDDPAVYLPRVPNPDSEEHLLAERTGYGLHDGAHVPFHMLAKVAVRMRRIGVWVGNVDGMFRTVRRHARISLGTLATTVVAIGGFAVHRIAAEATAAEHAAAQERAESVYREGVERQFRTMERDIRELRAVIQRLSGSEPASPSGDDRDIFPDKYANLRGPTCSFAERLHFP